MSKKSSKQPFPDSLDDASEEAPESSLEIPPEMALADSVEASTLPPHLSSALSGLIAEYRRLETEIEAYLASPDLTERQESYAGLKSQIEEICLQIPSKRILGPWGSTTRTAKTVTKLNQTKLMVESTKRGYDPIEVKAIIDLSTEKKKGKEYVLINIGK